MEEELKKKNNTITRCIYIQFICMHTTRWTQISLTYFPSIFSLSSFFFLWFKLKEKYRIAQLQHISALTLEWMKTILFDVHFTLFEKWKNKSYLNENQAAVNCCWVLYDKFIIYKKYNSSRSSRAICRHILLAWFVDENNTHDSLNVCRSTSTSYSH